MALLTESKKVTKNVILNYIKEIEPKYNSRVEFTSAVIDELQNLGSIYNSRRSVRILLGVLKYLLKEKYGDSPLVATNLKAMYPNEYPIKLEQTFNGFVQNQIVLDTTDCVKPKSTFAVILDIFPEIYTFDKSQEVRVDSNGVQCDNMLKPLSIDKFISILNLQNDISFRFLRGLLLGDQEFIACGCKKGFMVGVSKPTTYQNALQFKDSIMHGETFQIIPKSVWDKYPNKL